MKTILALLVAALVVNACVRFGDSAWRNYQLEDAINQEARFGDAKTASMLQGKIIQIAADKGVELTEDDVVVDGSQPTVDDRTGLGAQPSEQRAPGPHERLVDDGRASDREVHRRPLHGALDPARAGLAGRLRERLGDPDERVRAATPGHGLDDRVEGPLATRHPLDGQSCVSDGKYPASVGRR